MKKFCTISVKLAALTVFSFSLNQCKSVKNESASLKEGIQSEIQGYIVLPAKTADHSAAYSDSEGGPILNTEFDNLDFRINHSIIGENGKLVATFVVNKVNEGTVTGYLENLLRGKVTLRLDKRTPGSRECLLKSYIVPSEKEVSIVDCANSRSIGSVVVNRSQNRVMNLILRSGGNTYVFEYMKNKQMNIYEGGNNLIARATEGAKIDVHKIENAVSIKPAPVQIDADLVFFMYGLAKYVNPTQLNPQ